jgi:hypothetical protein
MAKRPIEEIYRDSNVPDDKTLSSLIAEMGEDFTLADLRRAYRGAESKIQTETMSRKKYEEENSQLRDLLTQAATQLQQLEEDRTRTIAGKGTQDQGNQFSWDELTGNELYAPVAKAVKGQFEMSAKEINELKETNKMLGSQLQNMTTLIRDFGQGIITKENRRDFESISDREPDITFEEAQKYASENGLWDDAYLQTNPNLRVPSVRKAYERLSEPKRQEKIIAKVREEVRNEVLKEMRGQSFFPPPPSSSTALSGNGKQPVNGIDGMEAAFRDITNDPSMRGFPF